MPEVVTREEMYYNYLAWVIYSGAAHAMRPVVDLLYAKASLEVPAHLRGKPDVLREENKLPGVTDLLLPAPGPHTLHPPLVLLEVKRAKVLTVSRAVLNALVALASAGQGWEFRKYSESDKAEEGPINCAPRCVNFS
jgi:hypothetical protein